MLPGVARTVKERLGTHGKYAVMLDTGRIVARSDNAGLAVQAADELEDNGVHAFVVSGGLCHYASHRVAMHEVVQ